MTMRIFNDRQLMQSMNGPVGVSLMGSPGQELLLSCTSCCAAVRIPMDGQRQAIPLVARPHLRPQHDREPQSSVSSPMFCLVRHAWQALLAALMAAADVACQQVRRRYIDSTG